jgi:hypothetical protein
MFRFARLQDDAEKEHNRGILQSSVPNIAMDKNNLLWFYDNEPGLLDAYNLMYASTVSTFPDGALTDSARFLNFHDQMLNTACVFRKETLKNVLRLYAQTEKNALAPFEEAIKRNAEFFINESGDNWLENDVKWTNYLRNNFRQRLFNVIERLRVCSTLNRH